MIQLSHLYLNTGKTIALARQTFVGKVMSLLFNMLSRLVIAFLPRSKHLLISWLKSPSAEILEPKKIKFLTVSIVSPSICHEMMGPDAMILVFWMLNMLFCVSFWVTSSNIFSTSLTVSSAKFKLLFEILKRKLKRKIFKYNTELGIMNLYVLSCRFN